MSEPKGAPQASTPDEGIEGTFGPLPLEEQATIDAEAFKAVMASFAASVTVITTIDAEGRPHALTATAFSSLSKHPPLCLVCVDQRARAHAVIRRERRFAVNILQHSQSEISAHFATSVDDKFDGIEWTPGEATGCPLLPEALAWMECRLFAEHPGGDHDIFIGELLQSGVRPGAPLVYFRGKYAELTES
ncbi:MAG: flavin reductase family protein [Polyangiaceae bacterium]|nr:flavin reductase family protein [Polyangiaceae bacterium]MCB9606187.1 flavin reductase family protein [Polyangiaceae bacterium]